jgi:hypothetical protein
MKKDIDYRTTCIMRMRNNNHLVLRFALPRGALTWSGVVGSKARHPLTLAETLDSRFGLVLEHIPPPQHKDALTINGRLRREVPSLGPLFVFLSLNLGNCSLSLGSSLSTENTSTTWNLKEIYSIKSSILDDNLKERHLVQKLEL